MPTEDQKTEAKTPGVQALSAAVGSALCPSCKGKKTKPYLVEKPGKLAEVKQRPCQWCDASGVVALPNHAYSIDEIAERANKLLAER